MQDSNSCINCGSSEAKPLLNFSMLTFQLLCHKVYYAIHIYEVKQKQSISNVRQKMPDVYLYICGKSPTLKYIFLVV